MHLVFTMLLALLLAGNAFSSPIITPPINRRHRFYACECLNQDLAWIGGSGGLLLASPSGLQRYVSNEETLYSISISSTYLWASGTLGEILRLSRNGDNPIRLISPTTEPLFGIHFKDDLSGFVVGNFGSAFKTADGGKSWQPLNLPFPPEYPDPSLNAIYFLDDRSGWIVGEFGLIFHTVDGGLSWAIQESKVTGNLLSTSFLNDRQGYVVGLSGLILTTTDSGKSWTRFQIHDQRHLVRVNTDPTTGQAWAVGTHGRIIKISNGSASQLPDLSLKWLGCIAPCGSAIFAAGDEGSLYWSDTGAQWNTLNGY